MKKLFLLLVFTLFGVAQSNQLRAPQAIGFVTTGWYNNTAFTTALAADWWGQSFIPNQAKTLNTVTIYCSLVTGSLGASDTVIALYSDSGAGVPGSSVESHAGQCTNNASLTISGFTTALTANTMYWIVVTNANGTPASNNFQLSYTNVSNTNGSAMPWFANGDGVANGTYGWMVKTSTNSGSTWTTPAAAGTGARLGYSDSTYDGYLITTTTRANSTGSGYRATGKQEAGVVFTLPSHAKYNVIGIAAQVTKISTPGSLQFRLYNGTTLIATTNTIAAGYVPAVSNGDSFFGYFSATQTIDCSSSCANIRVVIGDATSGDASTVGYQPPVLSVPNDAASLALKPMNGTLKMTVTADNTASPPVFTDTATDMMPFALLLDTNGEFTALSKPGSLIGGPSVFGGPGLVR